MKQDNIIELMEMIFKVSRQMKSEMSYSNDLTHLSVLQIQALFFINQKEKVTMGDIAQYFHIELPSATSLVNKLFDQNLIKRSEDQLDRRLVMIMLTSEGKKLFEQATRDRQKKVKKTLSFLSTSEKSALLTILQTIYSRLQKQNEN